MTHPIITDQDRLLEHELRDKPAPRVTIDEVADNILCFEYVKHVTPAGKVLRWAVLTTKSGFAVTGEPSCAMSPENDDPVVGERLALENAKSNLWSMMAYHKAALRSYTEATA